MADDDPGAVAARIGSVQMLPLDEQHRRAIAHDRMTARKFLTQAAVLGVAGVFIVLVVEYSAFHPGSRPWWMLLVMPVVLWILLIAYFIGNRRSARKDLRAGTFARYSGPLRLQVYVTSSNHKRDDTRTYKVVLGTFTEISVEGDCLRQLQEHLPMIGEADVAVHLQDLIHVRNQQGETVFVSSGMAAATETRA